MMKRCALGIVLLAASAHAQPPKVAGDKAAALTRALKYAGVKATTPVKGLREFTANDIHCGSTREGTDQELGDYKCTIDKHDIKDAAAYLLQTTLEAAGAKSEDHMSQHTTDAMVICAIDTTKTADEKYDCTFGVVIRAKAIKTKDLVQPVHIEKQPKQ
jgi:fructose-specific component phosphotransferase system IIB-like protein